MPTLPKQYQYLLNEPAPKMLIESLKLYGTKEIVGKEHNPIIMGWAAETGLSSVYLADETPWCGLVHAYICKQTGKDIVAGPLWALNWAKWGEPVVEPMLSDTVTFKRPGGGHVGLYVGEDKTAYHVLGGNQGNAHTIARIDKARLYAARRLYSIAAPDNIRKIFLNTNGPISTNEA